MKLSTARTLEAWLEAIGSVHQQEIDLGLARVREVAARLGVLKSNATVITIAGTNGKGSTVAGLEAIYLAAGYTVGAFTTPMMFKHNEEVRVNGVLASDEAFCEAFSAIEAARGEVTLTPFEFHTLAAWLIFKAHPLDVMLLEVGMGGRLDAVNCMDADVAVITSIDLDHMAWLGETREAIAYEKAGIMRTGRPVVVGDRCPPASLLAVVVELCTIPLFKGLDYDSEADEQGWSWWMGSSKRFKGLQSTLLHRDNLSTVLSVIELLQTRLPVSEASIRAGLSKARLPGRLERVEGPIPVILDVSHNPHAVSLLASHLSAKAFAGRTIAVFSMLGDKDIVACLSRIASLVDAWFVSPLVSARAASLTQLQAAFESASIKTVCFSKTIEAAYREAIAVAHPGDRVVVFGSFVTVAAIKRLMS